MFPKGKYNSVTTEKSKAEQDVSIMGYFKNCSKQAQQKHEQKCSQPTLTIIKTLLSASKERFLIINGR